MSSSTALASDGYLTATISMLPLVVRAIVTTLCVVLGLYLLFGAAYGWRWLSKLGKERGNEESRPLIQGGLTGILAGAVAFAHLALIITAAILSVQDEPSLSGAPLLVILVLPACIGAGLGGRWRWIADLCVGWTGGLSLTSLLAVSAHVKSQTARLILLAIFLPASLILASLLTIPRLHCRRLAHRVGLGLCSFTGAWLFILGIDVFTKVGLLDAVTLYARDAGIRMASETVDTDAAGVPTVVLWQDRRCQGLLAGAWLLSLVGTAFQIWRYSVLGDDPEHEWNSYLGTILSDEKTHRSGTGIGHTPLLDHGRLGVFTKQRGRFSRLFSSGSSRAPASYAGRASRGDMEAVPTLEIDDPHGGASPRSAALDRSTSTRKAPARYDDAYAGVGLGLYDDPAYGEVHDDDNTYGNEKDPGYLYDAGHRPIYHPQHYLQRNGSEPSFRSVPAYDASLPPAFPDSPDLGRTPSLSGSTVLGGDTPHIGSGQSGGYDALPGKQDRSSGSLASHKIVDGNPDKRRTSGPLKSVFGVSFDDHEPDSDPKPHWSGTRKAVLALSKRAEDDQTRSSNLAKAPTSPTRPKIAPRSTSASSASSSSSSVVSGTLQRPSPALSLSGPVAPRPPPASAYSYSPVLPATVENPYDQIAVQATPSLLNAIQRVSAAQKQAKEWRAAHATVPSPLGSPSLGDAGVMTSKDRQGLGIGVPHRDAEVLRAAAQRRRQSSNSEWWNEVERQAQLRSSSGSSAS